MIIKTKRLLLRPFTEQDAADVYEYLKAPAVHCFACMKLNSVQQAVEEMKHRAGETEYYFAITLKESGKVIGEIDAYPESGEPHADENSARDTFSPCWMLNAEYQGKGYAFEAAHAFFDYLFQEKGQGVFMHIPRRIIWQASTCAKNSGCEKKVYLRSLSPSLTTPTALPATKIPINTPF